MSGKLYLSSELVMNTENPSWPTAQHEFPFFPSALDYTPARRRTGISENDKTHGIKRFKDANKDWYSVTSLGKESLKCHTKLATSHMAVAMLLCLLRGKGSREDFLGAGPILPLALSTSDL